MSLYNSPSTHLKLRQGSAAPCVVCGVRVCEWVLLTTILMTVAGTRQRSPGSQQRAAKMNVPTMLVTKAYLGSLVESSLGLMRPCCVATMGCCGCAWTTCGCVV